MNRKYIQLTLALLGVLAINVAFAQDADSVAVSEEPMAEEIPTISLGVGIEGGTHSMGGFGVAVDFKRRVGVRLAYNTFNLSVEDIEYDYSGASLSNDLTVDRSHLLALVELSLLGKGAVRLVGGAGIFFNNSINVVSTIPGERGFNDVTITSEDIGEMVVDISTASNLNPYIGLAFGRSVPKRRVGIAMEFGAFNLGEYDVQMSATNLLEGNAQNAQTIQDDLNNSDIKWWPVMALRLNVRIK